MAWWVTQLYISVSLAVLDFFFRELANLVSLQHWLRIPPRSCTFLSRSVLPCAGPVLALISDIHLYGSHKVQPYSNAGLTGDL